MLRLRATLIGLLLAACAAEAPPGQNSALAQITGHRTVEQTYFDVLFEQVCAQRPQVSEVDYRAELLRLETVRREARRLGLEDTLDAAERKWADFSSRAEWDCSNDFGIGPLRQAIDRFAAAVASATRN